MVPAPRLASFLASAFIRDDGSIWAWGEGFTGALGDGTTMQRAVPGPVALVSGANAVDLLDGLAVAADSDGRIWLWGGSLTHSSAIQKTPVVLASLPGVVAIHLLDLDLHLLRTDGSVWFIRLDPYDPSRPQAVMAWSGLGQACQLSDLLVLGCDHRLYPLRDVPGDHGGLDGAGMLQDVIQVAAVHGRRTFVLRADGTVWGWGDNTGGILGDGSDRTTATPARVAGLDDVVAISARFDANLALRRDGTVWFWGLEDPAGFVVRRAPVMVEGLADVLEVHADVGQSLARTRDGSLWTFDNLGRTPVRVELP